MSKCSICNSKEIQELLNWKKHKIIRCNNCRLIFTTPLPSDSELQAFYQGFMFQKPENYEIQKKTWKRKKELKKLFGFSDDNKELSDKKFLDFGAGTGVVYKAARELGLESYYQDFDKQAEEFTMKNFGLTPEYIVDDIEKCDMKFDFIFSDNVIEHVKEPHTFIKNLLIRLEDGGTLVLKTPNASNSETFFNPIISLKGYLLQSLKYNSLLRAIRGYFKIFWHCDPPRHIYSFTEKSLEHLMTNLKHKTINYKISYYRTPWFSNTITKRFFSKDKKLTPMKSVAIRLIIWPTIPIETLLQSLKWLLLTLGILSPGGIILRINKAYNNK